MPTSGRDLAKGTVVTLVPTGLGFVLSGPLVGVICLCIALAISLVLWTPLGPWLGFHERTVDPRVRQVEGELALAREEAAYAKKFVEGAHEVDRAAYEVKWPDWRAKIAAYVGIALGRSAQARFTSNVDMDADIALLDALAADLRPEQVLADAPILEDAARARRENELGKNFSYSDAPQ